MNNLERKAKHLLYHPDVPELMDRQQEYLEKLYSFNMTSPKETDKRNQLLTEMCAEVGENCYIEPPMHANWGAHHLHLGSDVYINFNLTLVDDDDITIGNHCMIGPNVVMSTAGHPVLPILRQNSYQYNFPITIKDNVWIGSGVQILPGVTIGSNTVIGAGSVVTKDIPDNVVAYGNPCRVARPINDHDKESWMSGSSLKSIKVPVRN